MEIMTDLAHEHDFERREQAFLAQRNGTSWLSAEPDLVTIKLPTDVISELRDRAAHDGIALETRLAWLLTELVRGKRRI